MQTDSHTLTIESRILRRWNDSRLTWDPKLYDGLTGIFVNPDYLWTPKLLLNDSHSFYGLGTCHETNCLIKFDSQVSCLYPCHQTAKCKGDFTDFPYDIQNCNVVFKTMLSHENVTFDTDELSGTMVKDMNKRWEMLSGKAVFDPTQSDTVKFLFVMQRHGEAIYQQVKMPGYALITLTLSILWMKAGSFMRSVVCGASIYLHFSLMDRVWWQ